MGRAGLSGIDSGNDEPRQGPSRPRRRCKNTLRYNLKHFPEESLKPFEIKAKHPDEFLIDLYHLDGEMVVHELHQQGATLRTPRTITEVLVSLETCRCSQFAQLIRERLAL